MNKSVPSIWQIDKSVALGGKPITTADEIPWPENNQEMLGAVLEAEKQAIANYTQRIEQVETFRDKRLVVQLEDMVCDETIHSEETERILRDWPL